MHVLALHTVSQASHKSREGIRTAHVEHVPPVRKFFSIICLRTSLGTFGIVRVHGSDSVRQSIHRQSMRGVLARGGYCNDCSQNTQVGCFSDRSQNTHGLLGSAVDGMWRVHNWAHCVCQYSHAR